MTLVYGWYVILPTSDDQSGHINFCCVHPSGSFPMTLVRTQQQEGSIYSKDRKYTIMIAFPEYTNQYGNFNIVAFGLHCGICKIELEQV